MRFSNHAEVGRKYRTGRLLLESAVPSAFVTDVVLLPVYGVVLCFVSYKVLDELSHGQ